MTRSTAGKTLGKLQALAASALYARGAGNRPLLAQFRDLRQLRHLPGKLSTGDYYDLRLYEVAAQRPEDLPQYMGWRMNGELDRLFNEDPWRATANDKFLMYGLLQDMGVPTPNTLAVFSPTGRTLAGAEAFNDADSFIRYLQQITSPVFFKPNCGTYGRSAFAITGYEPDKEQWRLADGSTLGRERLAQILTFRPYRGVLVQAVLHPHESVRSVAGEATSCVRLNIMRNGGSPEIFNAFWKISTGANMTDNFGGGSNGNLIANVDIQTGEITRVIGGIAENYEELESHPTTTEPLLGFRLPDFDKVLPRISRAVTALAGLNFQHWDVAFTDAGPVAMEINLEPDFHIIQSLRGRGILDDKMQGYIKARRDDLHETRAAVALREERPELGL